eukprot:gnl/MRDRNA2_/MRDRNA2_86731_c0_seq5.p1 gnl/MRDRNA2_/MRDRNA2_86731_c0~~gnl/MRDRNA2_/MRDRNA2_86731_c0_seq5.p1  ORF type:complete len:237 (+),score=52.38 gnl/MRDRNA2_/MRDRNA2_86731_c0_seq5:41-712(+)
MPWKQKDMKLNELDRAPRMQQGAQLRTMGVTCERDHTKPPDYLKEAELIALMDQKGIGTDASIPQHVQNILDRRYANVCGPGYDGKAGKPIPTEQQLYAMRKKNPNAPREEITSRHMVPTGLGLALIEAYRRVDNELCEPSVRAFMEKQVSQIADGSSTMEDVIKHNIELFHKKYCNFRDQLDKITPIFTPKWGGGGGGGGYKYGGGGGGGGAFDCLDGKACG